MADDNEVVYGWLPTAPPLLGLAAAAPRTAKEAKDKKKS